MFCVHCASSLLLAAPARAAAPLWTGDETVLPRLQDHPLRPDSNPGFVTRLVAAAAGLDMVMIAPATSAAQARAAFRARDGGLWERWRSMAPPYVGQLKGKFPNRVAYGNRLI